MIAEEKGKIGSCLMGTDRASGFQDEKIFADWMHNSVNTQHH